VTCELYCAYLLIESTEKLFCYLEGGSGGGGGGGGEEEEKELFTLKSLFHKLVVSFGFVLRVGSEIAK